MKSLKKAIWYGVGFNSTRMIVGATSVFFLTSKGFDLLGIALLKSFQAGIILGIDVPLAYISDKKSRRFSVAIASFCSFLWLIITALSTKKYAFYIGEFFNAISLAFFGGAFTSILIQEAKSNKVSISIVLSRYAKYVHLSMAASVVISTSLWMPTSNLFWLCAAGLMLALSAFTFALLPKNSFADREKAVHDKNDLETFFAMLRTRVFRKSLVGIVIVGLLFEFFAQYWQPVALFFFEGSHDKSLPYGLTFVLILVAQSLAGLFYENYHIKIDLLNFGSLSLSASLLGFYFGVKGYPEVIIPSILAIFFSIKILLLSIWACFHESIDDSMRSTYDSFSSTLLRLSIITTLPFFAYLLNSKLYLVLVSIFCVLSLFVSRFIFSKAHNLKT